MAGCILIGVLTAFGGFCALWCLAGLFLPRSETATVVFCHPGRAEAQLRRQLWLRELGLTAGAVIAVTADLSQQERSCLARKYRKVEFCGPEELASRLDAEEKRLGRDGNGDPQRRG